MSESHTPRRALKDLPVNTFGTPHAPLLSPSNKRNLKRQIHEVDNPALPPLSTRPWPSDSAPRSSSTEPQQHWPAPASRPTPCAESEHGGDSFLEANTQETSNDTVSTIVGSDLEGDTIETQATAATEFSPITRSSSLSKAETLRLRLRLAMFRVETHQIDIPLSLLRIPTPNAHDNTAPAITSPSCDTPSQPTLLPAPLLKPSNLRDRITTEPDMLSSPPRSGKRVAVKEPSPETFRTPALPRQRSQPLQQPSSSPDSRHGDYAAKGEEGSRLSSSAVKGHAAISLLDLRDDKR